MERYAGCGWWLSQDDLSIMLDPGMGGEISPGAHHADLQG
jgi:hypothetical protein